MNTRKLRKSIVQLNNELLNNALSFKPILLVPKAIIYHQGFPFPRLKSRNQKKKEKKKPQQKPPKPTPPERLFSFYCGKMGTKGDRSCLL